MEYSTTYGGYPTALAALGGPAGGTATSSSAELIDAVLAGGTKSGYTFTYTTGATDSNGNILAYTMTAIADQHRRDRPTDVLHRPVRRDPCGCDGIGEWSHDQQHSTELVEHRSLSGCLFRFVSLQGRRSLVGPVYFAEESFQGTHWFT